MEAEQSRFVDSLNSNKKIINSLYIYNNLEDHRKNKEIMDTIKQKLVDIEQKTKIFNNRETMFAKKKSDYSMLLRLKKNFEPYLEMWTIVNHWKEHRPRWLHDYWGAVDAQSAEQFVDLGVRALVGVVKHFREKIKEDPDDKPHLQNMILIAQSIRREIEDFKPKVPLLVALKKPGMQRRHWEEIFGRIGQSFIVNDTLTFQTLLDKGMLRHIKVCCEVGEKAEREFHIEKLLTEMQTTWEEVAFSLVQYKRTGVWVIQNYEEIENKVDEHLGTTQMLLVNPFNRPFQQVIDKWFNQLLLVNNTLEEWKRLQVHWCYLQPIFDSADIVNELPNASTMFKKVDNYFTKTMSQTKVQKKVLKVCVSEDHYDNFIATNRDLDKIQRALKNYLEKKKSVFGRFYFLSNDALLSILSETKEVERIQDHLRKVFENIARLNFSDEKHILGMSSVEKEYIPFEAFKVVPTHKPVERWMKEVEDSMQRSVRRCMLHAIAEYPKHPRIEWIMRHPGQCVLNGSQTFWTSEVEAAVGEGALAQYLTRLDGQIQDIVQIDRTQLSRNQLVTLEALLVLDVHARNVVKKLVSAEIDSVFSFEWISQLRYYIENEQMRVKCLQTDLLYGNEYLGNTNRLVITPLTDKCYMTLMSALKLNLGGSPMGPAGTGKTESTKDLAKALAKQIVVFNCQESMDHQFLAQYFKGLASTGAWCCFDEFNRINVEVLSVIAQQLQELFRAKNEDRKKLFFENSEIELVNTFSVFITMNPNYAGRQTLPDNLKALFRPVAMMVPNYRLIAQIKLYSFGFLSAPVLAKKMVATFKLSSEQLSEEYHYDYGMRAVSTLINAAGLIKQKNPDMPEDQILLKALKDVNEPKFLEQDQPLFKNIIKDLFPEVPEPERNYDRLQETLAASCLALNLQKKPDFLQKVYQLHDTIQVRHAVMLVGPSGGGKSSVCNALRHALCRLNPKKGLKVEERIVLKVINPKAVDMDNLYGVSRDLNWHEGIIEVEMEKAIENQFHETKSEQCFWILFDGPVDPSWIESMNTVLDDNRKLCLSSAKVLMLSQFITMMFEVDDVSKASLATISRCGMVYMEPEQLGHGVVVDSFLDAKNPKLFTPAVRSQFKDLQARILEPTLAFVRKQCKELVATADCNLVSSFCTLFNCFMQTINLYNFLGKEGQKELEKYILTRINNCFLFCLTWSVCASIDRESRIKSVFFLSKLLEQLRPDLFTSFPGEIYDFNYDFEENSFAAWTVGAPAEGPQAHFTEIVVPTKMFQSNLFLQSLLLRNKIHVLIPGPTGTGKSTNCLSLLSKGLDSNFISASIVLSAQTHQDQIQELIFSQIIKRKRAVFGPASGKRLVVFIDDMNMPQKQFFGDQPPLELTRQILDRGGCYVWKSQKEYICLEDVFVLAAMNPHTRDPMPPRLVRQFFVLGYPELEKSTLAAIFDHLLSHSLGRYNEVVKSLIPQLIELQLSLFEQVRAKLLPIPSKPHYQFNLRDISRVFQGVSRSTPKTIDSKKRLVQLWNHENCRVFRDRLTDKDDELLFDGILEAELAKLDLTPKDLLKENSRIIFADFLDGVEAERNYQHIESTSFFIRKLESILRDFNEETQDTSKKLDLVLFLDACEHISRISRIISQPEGHALLLGVGGSGRRSLSKLSAYINMHKLYTVEVGKGYNFAKWREDLKDLILQAVAQNRQLTFLVSDTQMVDTRMLEDINCLLNTGNILGMQLNQDEKKKVDDAAKLECSKKGLTPTQVNLQQQAVQLVKMNTHVVFCMSPLREGFLDKLRMFPSLISCCTIDWFHEWPKQALLEVAHEGLAKLGEESNPKLEEFFARAQIMAKGQSEALRREQKRHNFVTPTIYLELLKSFDMNLKEKQKRNRFAISRLKNGLEKLKAANKNMELIHEQLEREKPTLRRTEIEVKEMISTIEEDKKTADTKRDHIINEEKKAIEAEREASKLAKEVEESVNEVDRKLKKTRENINQLKQDKITFLRNLDNPTVKIRYCYMAAVLLLMDYSELEVRNSWTETEKVNYFMKVFRSRFLKDPKFLDNIKNMDYKNVPATRLVKIKEMVIEHPLRGKAWNKTDMHKSSFACYCLYLLIQAALEFNKLYQVTQPLRDKQIRIDKSLREKRMQLIERKKEIHDINQKLDELENLFEVKNREKNLLKEKIEGCNVKLERAKKLTSLLDDENRRWMSEIVRLQEDTLFIEGDAAFGGAMLTFAGPFPTAFREQMQADFLDCLDELQIPRSRDTSMVRCLGDDVRIQGWGLHGLPKDPTSIENGIILDLSLRWTFLIDPQRQGLKYLKNSARDHESGFEVVKYSDKGLMKKLEQSIHFGKIFIIENCPSKLDPGLDPLLNKKIGKANGSLTLTLGEKMIPYSTNFKLLLVSCQENPEFSPEVCAKVTIINFNATPTGLVEQMLATIVILENRQLEDQKNDILRKNAIDKRALVKYEDEILKTLNESNQDFLNSNSLINKLATSKRTSSEIKTRVQDSKMTEAKIDAVRETYRPLAIQVSKLYFAICDLSKLDPMYEYSLQWFDQLFRTAVESAELSNDLQKRSHFLISKFTEILFKNVSRSLFEKHKLLFSFLLCTRLMQIEHRLDPKELHFLISPPSDARLRENPTEYIPETIWPSFYKKLVGLSSLKKFKEMEKAFFLNPTSFKYLCESESPLEATLPNFLETSLNGQDFSRLLLVKLFREDKLISSIQSFVSKTLGELYIKPPPLNLLECFADSTPSTPLVFLLSSGSDPKADFDKLAEELEINDIKSISLGSGQGRRAEEMILKAMKTGAWILLQNCHLAPSWMPKLEEICEGLSETISKDFRLWLTSKPSSRFPVSILQNSIKITLEPPRGLNANLKKTFLSFDEEAFNEKSPVLRKLTYALSFFHAVIQERRGFGPIGWNIPYSFTFEDFQVSLKQLDSILQSHKDVPFKVLNFLVAEINYGGRVTDDKDERLIRSLLKNYFCPEIFKKTYALSESGKYLSPPVLDRDEYLDFIDRDIPLLPESEVFFLHKNAEITTNENNAQQFTRQFMTMEFNQVGSADASSNVKSTRLIQSIRDKVPQCFDQENVSSKYPTQYEESMNTVLNQEVIRFNALIRKVRLDLHQLEKALQGQQILSKELEVVQQTLERLEVPKAWGYPLGFLSLKSLNSWLEDLLQRHEFLKDWITLGKPGIFWFSGFFFPQAFITGTLQNYARKYNIAIDRVAFDFVIKDDLDEAEVLSSRRGPADGVYVNGIFLEGAQWSRSFGRLDQPVNRKLFAECPVIHLLPRLAEDVKTEGMYECPLYKVVSRQGSLNTTGHSNNFVMYLRFRSELSQDYWIRRGVAAFLSLSY